MQTVYFYDRYGKKREIGKGESNSDSKDIILKFLRSHNYECYYWRYWINGDGIMRVDVGSHRESFSIESEDGDMKWEETTNDN